jgi:hypothetical protein
MDSIDGSTVKSVILGNGTRTKGSDPRDRHPTTVTLRFNDGSTSKPFEYLTWTEAIGAIRQQTGDNFVCKDQRQLEAKKLPLEYTRLSAREIESPFKHAQSVTLTPSGRSFKTVVGGEPGPSETWTQLRALMTPYFFDANAKAPKEETVYTRRDQEVINKALRKRRRVGPPSQDGEAGSSRVTSGGASDGIRSAESDAVGQEGVIGSSDVSAQTQGTGKVYWDPVRNI